MYRDKNANLVCTEHREMSLAPDKENMLLFFNLKMSQGRGKWYGRAQKSVGHWEVGEFGLVMNLPLDGSRPGASHPSWPSFTEERTFITSKT
jgi:hypothetical protein